MVVRAVAAFEPMRGLNDAEVNGTIRALAFALAQVNGWVHETREALFDDGRHGYCPLPPSSGSRNPCARR